MIRKAIRLVLRCIGIFVAATALLIFAYVLFNTHWGKKYRQVTEADMRATADDQFAVQACGIPVTRIFSTSWMFACVVAAIAGILISWIGGLSMGLVETGLKSFSVVILGSFHC